MKGINSIKIIYVFMFFLLLVMLAGCVQEEKKVVFCNDFPDDANCTCSNGFLKESYWYYYTDVNRVQSVRYKYRCLDKSYNLSCFDSPENIDCMCPDGLVKKSREYIYSVNRSKNYMYHCINVSCNEVGDFSLNETCVKSCPKEYARVYISDAGEDRGYSQCLFIKNASEMICDKFPNFNEDCVCPKGQKPLGSMGGISCVEESFCTGYTLSDNESNCVPGCPEGYMPLIVTDTGQAGTCINVKQIDKDNVYWYTRYIIRKSNLSFMKRYDKQCSIADEFELGNKFGVRLKCQYYPENCSFYIYPNTTIVDIGCSNE
ncbi:MAG: hypothetical protein Q8O89_04600 [Nanoarchaeota archaeon]|nr:hypothetical protein [Nanoarchaeota archaeon]